MSARRPLPLPCSMRGAALLPPTGARTGGLTAGLTAGLTGALAGALLCALTSSAGCALSGRDEAGPSDGGADVGSGPRGSAACRHWQDAFCSYAADRCGLIDRDRCDDQNRGVVCRDDDDATRCAGEFDAAACGRPPQGCEVVDIADRRAAAEKCEVYFQAQCESNTRCGIFIDIDECLASTLFDFDCDTALSIGLNYERCLHELATRRCDRPAPICDEVIHAR